MQKGRVFSDNVIFDGNSYFYTLAGGRKTPGPHTFLARSIPRRLVPSAAPSLAGVNCYSSLNDSGVGHFGGKIIGQRRFMKNT